MNRLPVLTIAVALAIGTAACSDDDASPTTTSSPTTSTVASSVASTAATADPTTAESTTSPSTAPPTTTPVATEPPTTSTTPSIAADDWKAILEELARRRVSLYAGPDLAHIVDYCAPASECAEGLETQLGDAIAKGQHIEGQHPFEVLEVSSATVSDVQPLGKLAEVTFVVAPDAPPAAQLVDAAGNVIDTLSITTTKSKARFTLALADDTTLPWRVLVAEDLGPVP